MTGGGRYASRNPQAKPNVDILTPLLTNPQTGEVSGQDILKVIAALNAVRDNVMQQQTDANEKRKGGISSLLKQGVFPKVPKGGSKKNPQVQNVKALAARSRDWYNAQDEETKRTALKYTMGYLNTQQFELNRSESTSDALVDLRYLGEINIGSSHIENVLANCQSILDENVSSIFVSLKTLTENLNNYFANGLQDDSKASSAITAADNIETRTKEVSDV